MILAERSRSLGLLQVVYKRLKESRAGWKTLEEAGERKRHRGRRIKLRGNSDDS